MLQLRFVFVCHCYLLLLPHNYLIYLLKWFRFLMTLEIAKTCELCMEVTL